MKLLHSFKHKNLFLLFLSIIAAIVLSKVEAFNTLLLTLGNFGYLGAFVAGMLFVVSFTAATGAIILIALATFLSPLEIGIIAGFGAVLGDLIIFRFIKDDLVEELSPVYHKLGGDHLTRVLHTKYFSWTLPVIGALIIASPLPDEIGVSLLGIAKMKTYKFILLSFLLNTIGIFLIISASVIYPK